jgi:hypothetical protein
MTPVLALVLACLNLALVSTGPGSSPDISTEKGERLSLERLARLSWEELDCLYRQAQPGRPPCGVLDGRVIYDNQRKLSGLRTAGAKALWLGKEFDQEQGMLINRWRFGRAIKAEIYPGQSWLDGGPALITDYRQTSLVWRKIRDEVREVAPGLYLGVMFRCEKEGAHLVVFFALEECGR